MFAAILSELHRAEKITLGRTSHWPHLSYHACVKVEETCDTKNTMSCMTKVSFLRLFSLALPKQFFFALLLGTML